MSFPKCDMAALCHILSFGIMWGRVGASTSSFGKLVMADYKLYCFGESGNAYKAALMLAACQLRWTPIWVDFFKGETRSPEYRTGINEMGEVPVLLHGAKKISQSGVILDYLAEQTRKFEPKSEDERREILRWMLFDNHKFSSYIATLRFTNSLKIIDGHLATQPFLIGKRITIADFSLCGYMYFGEELPVDLDPFTHVLNWLDRIKSLPDWKHPYDLMPRA
jgi:glutathione S-transferase